LIRGKHFSSLSLARPLIRSLEAYIWLVTQRRTLGRRRHRISRDK